MRCYTLFLMLDNPERHVEHLHHVREDLLPVLVPELLHLDLIAVETREMTVFEQAEHSKKEDVEDQRND